MDWNLLWFVLLGVLLVGYAILDGFDLGVGILHLGTRGDHERRIFINSIGPLWDGNEVWLVTFGGALFAAFPEAYASAFSGFYSAFMALLASLIFRAVSIEFRGKLQNRWWRATWDGMFFAASTTATLLFGVAVGAAMQGVPLNRRGVLHSSLIEQLTWYPLLVGALTIALFGLHGALYLRLKTSGELQARITRWAWRWHWAFVSLYLATTIATALAVPHAVRNFEDYPWAWGIVILNVLAVLNLSRSLKTGRPLQAFVSSSCVIAALVFLFGMALFPNLITSLPNPQHSLTIYNAASSQTTLKIITLFALFGMPFVIAYTVVVYWAFRGEVKLDEHSY
jgi:cytochrome bd ubiquinol oxidase subunit II